MALNTKKSVQELISYSIVTDKKGVINLLKSNGVKVGNDISNAKLTTAVLVANKKSPIFKKKLGSLLESKLNKAGEKFSNIVGNSQDFGFTGVDDVTYMKGFTGVDDFSDFTGWDDFQSMSGVKSPLKISQPTLNYKPQGLPAIPSNLSTSISSDSTNKKIKLTAAERKASGQKTKVGAALSNLWSFTKTNVLTKENINAGIQVGLDKINQDSLSRQNALEQQSMAMQQQQADMQRQLGKGAGVSGNTVLYIGIGVIALVGIGFLIYRQSKK